MCPELLGNTPVDGSLKNGGDFDSSDGRSDLVSPRTNFLAILGHFSRPRDWSNHSSPFTRQEFPNALEVPA